MKARLEEIIDYVKEHAKEHAREVTHGVWAAVTTPFTAAGDLDEEGLRNNIAYLIEEILVDGIFCTGSMGEFWSLTREERFRCTDIVVDEAKRRCLVNVHTGHHSARETVALTNYAENAGADFVSIATPYYPAHNDTGLVDWFHEVCSRTDIGVWLFDGPFNGTRESAMSPGAASRIADIPNVCGMKVAWPLDEHQSYHRRLHDRLVLSNPREDLLLQLITEFGQQVHMSSAAPYKFQRPGYLPIREYMRHAMAGDHELALRVSESLEPVRAVDRTWIGTRSVSGPPIAFLKAWTSLMGMAAGPARPPVEPADANASEKLRDDLVKVGLVPPA